jgi:hypothetical protein
MNKINSISTEKGVTIDKFETLLVITLATGKER